MEMTTSKSPRLIGAAAILLCVAALLSGCGDSSTSPDTPEGVRQPGGDVNDFWDQFGWSDLSSDERALWEALGWDEASWQGETAAPASEEKEWSELTDAERAAAERLGYDEAQWNS